MKTYFFQISESIPKHYSQLKLQRTLFFLVYKNIIRLTITQFRTYLFRHCHLRFFEFINMKNHLNNIFLFILKKFKFTTFTIFLNYYKIIEKVMEYKKLYLILSFE